MSSVPRLGRERGPGGSSGGVGALGRVVRRGEMRPSEQGSLPKVPCERGWQRAHGTKRAADLGWAGESSARAACVVPLSRTTRSPGPSLGNKNRAGGRSGGRQSGLTVPQPSCAPKVRLTAPQEMLTGSLTGMPRN